MKYVTGVILVMALLISGPFHLLSEGVGLFVYALYSGYKDGWYRGKKFWY